MKILKNTLLISVAFCLLMCGCNPGPDKLLKKANRLFADKNYMQAVTYYSRVIELNPNSVMAYSKRAMAYEKIFDNKKALEDYKKAISLDSSNLKVYNNLGSLCVKISLYDDAVKYLTQAIAINPEYQLAHINRGAAYMKLKKYDASLSDFGTVIELNPKSIVAYYNRGLVYVELKRYANAIDDFNKTLTLNKKFIRGYYELSKVYLEQKNYKSALENFKKVIASGTRDGMLYYNSAICASNLDMKQEAIKYVDRALEITVDNPAFYELRGDLTYEYDPEFAWQNYMYAANLDPQNVAKYQSKIDKIKKYLTEYSKKDSSVEETDL
ncbi:MAG TPA: tetratricopeptide repeat protein [Elusimicrobiales bacterium]|nr:tetratricopeptide repeat protein [Elusimicrobiales bacterium]